MPDMAGGKNVCLLLGKKSVTTIAGLPRKESR